jgi:3-hydroxyisobutyrate dehydrogenase-like beta-hydroxyacid dehydrogenase
MANIAFLGMGSMGARMATKLLDAGHTLSVWNRNEERAKPLGDAGARVAATPRDAANGADFVLSMLTNNEASMSVWCDKRDGALSGMKSGAIAIECSTLSVDYIGKLKQQCDDRNIAFLDAPVAGSRPQADAAQLIFFVGGAKSDFESALLMLSSMGSQIHYAGKSGAGTSIKLAVNALFGIQLATIAELIGLLKTSGLNEMSAVEILSSTPVCSPAAKQASGAMLAKKFSPMFPIKLVKKDFEYALSTAKEKGIDSPMTQAGLSVFNAAIERGFGEDNITGVAQLYS